MGRAEGKPALLNPPQPTPTSTATGNPHTPQDITGRALTCSKLLYDRERHQIEHMGWDGALLAAGLQGRMN